LRLHSFRPYDLSGVWRINLRSRMEFGVNTREDFYMYKEISCPNLIHKRMWLKRRSTEFGNSILQSQQFITPLKHEFFVHYIFHNSGRTPQYTHCIYFSNTSCL